MLTSEQRKDMRRLAKECGGTASDERDSDSKVCMLMTLDELHQFAIRFAASAAPAEGLETLAEIPEGWMLVKRERIEEIEARMNPDLAEDYRGCGLYDDDATRANFNVCNSALGDIRTAVESIREDFAPVLLPARAALATAPTMSEARLDVIEAAKRVIGSGVVRDGKFAASVFAISQLSIAIDRAAAKEKS